MLLILLATLSLVAAQAPTFVGCTSTFTGEIVGVTLAGSAANCATFCQGFLGGPANFPQAYSVFQSVITGVTAINCRCVTDFPAASTVTSSSSATTPDICASPSDYSTYRLFTTFVFDQCYNGITGAVESNPDTVVSNIGECFTFCRGFPGMFIDPALLRGGNSGFFCVCTTTETFISPVTCSRDGAAFRFTHPAPAASAMLTRKRKVAARLAKLERGLESVMSLGKVDYCPAGLTACKVQGSDEGYECIDTMSELESCGGCVFGEFGVEAGPRGVNCAAVESSSLEINQMTCKMGRCASIA